MRTLQNALTATVQITLVGKMTGTGRRTNDAVGNPSQATSRALTKTSERMIGMGKLRMPAAGDTYSAGGPEK